MNELLIDNGSVVHTRPSGLGILSFLHDDAGICGFKSYELCLLMFEHCNISDRSAQFLSAILPWYRYAMPILLVDVRFVLF